MMAYFPHQIDNSVFIDITKLWIVMEIRRYYRSAGHTVMLSKKFKKSFLKKYSIRISSRY